MTAPTQDPLVFIVQCECCRCFFTDGEEKTFTQNCRESQHSLCLACINHLGHKKCPTCDQKQYKCRVANKRCSECKRLKAQVNHPMCSNCMLMFSAPAEEKQVPLCVFNFTRADRCRTRCWRFARSTAR